MLNRAIDWGERLVLALLFAQFAALNIHSNDAVNWSFLTLETMTVFFVLIRRRALSMTEHPGDWVLAFAGTLFPLLVTPSGDPSAGWPALTLIVIGTAMAASAKLSLNRRFGIAPANRGIQASWAYSVVRHPMYAGYVVAQAGYLMHNPTARNLLIYLVAWGLQAARIWREERHLMKDPAYQAYASKVRFRLVPGIY